MRDLLIICTEAINKVFRNLFGTKPPMTFTGTLETISSKISKEIEKPVMEKVMADYLQQQFRAI